MMAGTFRTGNWHFVGCAFSIACPILIEEIYKNVVLKAVSLDLRHSSISTQIFPAHCPKNLRVNRNIHSCMRNSDNNNYTRWLFNRYHKKTMDYTLIDSFTSELYDFAYAFQSNSINTHSNWQYKFSKLFQWIFVSLPEKCDMHATQMCICRTLEHQHETQNKH